MNTQRPRRSRSALFVLATATAAGSMGLGAGGTAGALIATQMTGSMASAGLPLGLLVAGSALGAALISRQTQRRGRASGLILGYALGTVGAAIVTIGAVVVDFGAVLAGSAVLGAANAAVFLSRYAAVDLGGDAVRGRSVGVVFAAAAVGAVASPNLLGPSGQLASRLGLPFLTGLYLVAGASFVIAAALVAALARSSAVGQTGRLEPTAGPDVRDALRRPAVRLAMVILAITNLVMAATMAVVPVHLSAHGHDFGRIGVFVGVHVLGMFAPSPLSGWLADRIGGAAVAAIGAVLLIASGLTGAIADPHDTPALIAVLALLGVGWNAGAVGGSTLLVASVPPGVRPHAEGIGEVAMGFAAAASAPAAGLIIAFGGYPTLVLASAAVSAVILAAVQLTPRSTPPRRVPTVLPGADASHTRPGLGASHRTTSATSRPELNDYEETLSPTCLQAVGRNLDNRPVKNPEAEVRHDSMRRGLQ